MTPPPTRRPRLRHAFATTALLAMALGLAPATAHAAGDHDHSQTIVVGPSEQPFSAASTGSTDTEAIVFNGRGSYHSIGMSQYGARGQARDGRSAARILGTYYAGTSVEGRTPGFPLRVAVVRDTPRIRVLPRGGGMAVSFPDRQRLWGAADTSWTVTVDARGRCSTTGPDGPVHTGGCPTFDPAARIEVQQPSGSGWVRYGDYGSDAYASGAVVDLVPDQLESGGWRLDTVVQLPLEQYLYGLAEVPYSWEQAALQAQAIAGRSYAMHRMLTRGRTPDSGCSCHLWDSQQDQVYRGHERETGPRWSDWRAAVDATATRVVVAGAGQAGYDETADGVVQAFYSASSHGRTENKHEVWSPSPWDYMVSVKDDWSLQAPNNPYASWTRSFSREAVAAKVGLPSIDSVAVTERRQSGSAKTVAFRGGGRTVTLSGDQVRWKFGLLSNGFGIGDESWDGYTPPPPTDLFTDDDDSVHESDIDWLSNRDITKGCNPPDNTRFCPEETVTREQMAAFLTRALTLRSGTATFEDTGSSIFVKEIASLADAGITKGCNPPSNTRYCPTDPVTRAQMASFLTRALDLPGGPTGTFTDVPAGSTHEQTIAALARAGITVGCNPPDNTRFCPEDPVTRAQMATFLFRGLG